MAESKFLPFQDVNGDGIIDACEIQTDVPEQKCACVPNLCAIVPDWKIRKIYEPFLNQKICYFQITVPTPHPTTGATEENTEQEAAAALDEIFDEFVDKAIQVLLDVYSKDDSDSSKEIVKDAIEKTDYYLDIRPKSRLKLLYSVPFHIMENLDDADAEEESEPEPEDVVVTYYASDLHEKLVRIRKGLNLYARHLNFARSRDGLNFLFLEDNRVFDLGIYGGYGEDTRLGLMGDALAQLEEFLNTKGYKIPYVGGWNGKADAVYKLEFTFNSKYILKKLNVYTVPCPNDAITFEKQLNPLKTKSAWKDRTAMGYFARLDDMELDLIARTPLPWIEFIIKYTYPEVYDMSEYIRSDSAASCVGEALVSEGKQLGQDVMDIAFSLGDVIAYKFHQNICMTDKEDLKKEWDWRYPNPDNPDQESDLFDLAKAQAWQELEADDQVFRGLCSFFLNPEMNLRGLGKDFITQMRATWDDLGLCGLIDLLTQSIQCLMGGMTLEEALADICGAAIRAMSMDNFGKLFVGLPPEDQAKLDAMVQANIESGNIFKGGTGFDLASDSATGNYSQVKAEDAAEFFRVFEDPANIEAARATRIEGTHNSTTQSDFEGLGQQQVRQSLAPTKTGDWTSTIAGDPNQLNTNLVMEAYASALLEMFKGKELELVDRLNNFPGAPLIGNILSVMVCPMPPLFEPSFVDFIKDFEFPWLCGEPLVRPRFVMPKFDYTDLWGKLFDAILDAIKYVFYLILSKLFYKLCQIIGDTVCKALEVVGDIAVAAVKGNPVKDAIRESICGPDVDDQVLDDTITELFALFGTGAAAFADQEKTLSLAADIGAVLTEKELARVFLGEASDSTIQLISGVVENDYPEFEDAFSGPDTIRSAFKNMGNVMPVEFRGGLRDRLAAPPDNDLMPANPTLCLTPEQAEEFCELRAQLLAGRASKEQIAKLCARPDLSEIAAIAESVPNFINCNMPPLVSDPGCDNGLLPYEPESIIQATTSAVSGLLERLKVDFSKDMLGNGPFAQRNWGMINMILSDTMAKPLTAHYRKAFNKKSYVDFYSTYSPDDGNFNFTTFSGISQIANISSPENEEGAFPTEVAMWLAKYMNALEPEFSSNNVVVGDYPITVPFDELPGYGRSVSKWELPDLGYDVEFDIDYENKEAKFIKKGRKKDPDLVLSFDDNAKGLKALGESAYAYGYDVKLYLSDLREYTGQKGSTSYDDGHRHSYNVDADGNGTTSYADAHTHVITKGKVQEVCEEGEECHTHILLDYSYGGTSSYRNRLSDNARIKIVNRFNEKAEQEISNKKLLALVSDPAKKDELKSENDEESILYDIEYEFYASDDTLADIDFGDYPDFLNCFQSKQEYMPQVVLFAELLNNNNASTISPATIKSFHDSIMSQMTKTFLSEVATNPTAWNYGAEYDALTSDECDYVVDEGQTESPGGTSYGEAEVIDEDGELRGIVNDDMILGISRMEWLIKSGQKEEGTENRVFYLEPSIYGSNYMRPSIYITPLKNQAWLGFVDVMFPELSPCKPQRTDLVDFGEIQDKVSEVYPNIPEDERLQQDPDCAQEIPYNRILDRASAAGLQGLITAATRIYASAHFIKTMATFTKFYPRFPETFSSLYAAYIVEDMEQSFKDAQPGFGEALNPFKDEEFWYAFLEQSVQMYARRVEDEDVEPSQKILQALARLNEMQLDYLYPNKDDLKTARENGETKRRFLKNYRSDKNLEAIKETEEDAKIILTELVAEQLNYMGEKFIKNLEIVGMKPDVFDLDFYLLENFTQGSSLTIDKPLEELYAGLPTIPYEENEDQEEPYYTSGAQFVVGEDNNHDNEFSLGDEYIGEFHVHIDEDDGEVVYMSGPEHFDELYDVLYPMANITSVQIGDVASYPFTASSSTTQPFVIEKYISINGTKTSPSTAENTIQAYGSSVNISDIYPGTLELVYDEEGEPIGLTGELGVRHGLLFSIVINGSKYEITSVEIDALDTAPSAFDPAGSDSKLLLCLINHLKEDDKFKLVARYIFPLTKITATTAIYNDMGFLPSIGEITAAPGMVTPGPGPGALDNFDPDDKPGNYVDVKVEKDETTGTSYVSDVDIYGNEGWAAFEDRDSFGSLFVLEFDKWDQILLRNSKRTIKNQFKAYYNSREFDIEDIGHTEGPAQAYLNKLKGALAPSPGERVLTRFRRRRLRTNPFNADGKMCEK